MTVYSRPESPIFTPLAIVKPLARHLDKSMKGLKNGQMYDG